MTSLDFLYVALGISALITAAAAAFAMVNAGLFFRELRASLASVADDLPAIVRSLRATLEELETSAESVSAALRTLTGFISWLRELGGLFSGIASGLSFAKNLFRRRS